MTDFENKTMYEKGTEVWYFEPWNTISHGIIQDYQKTPTGCFAILRENGCNTREKLKNIWPSKAICLEMEEKKTKAKIAAYKRQITSVEDLVRFLYRKSVNDSECPNYEAKQAAEERAKELLGIVLSMED